MTETIPTLAEALEKALKRLDAMSSEEREKMYAAQRRSFARAEAGFGSDVQEAEYRQALRSGNQEAIVKCEAEAQDRIAKLRDGGKE